MHHDHDSNGTCGETIAYLPHQLPGFIFRLILNLEHAAEVLSKTMGCASLQHTPCTVFTVHPSTVYCLLLLFAVCCLLFAVCCLLVSVCWLLFALYCPLCAVCCVLCAVCCILSTVHCLLSRDIHNVVILPANMFHSVFNCYCLLSTVYSPGTHTTL